MRKLNQGTKEYLDVEVIDDQGTLSSLDGLGLQFKILDEDDATAVDWTSGNNVGMRAFCLVDTGTGYDGTGEAWGGSDIWPEARYRLHLRFTLAPEVPIVGPIEFAVSAL